MTAIAEATERSLSEREFSTDIVVREHQLRIAETEATMAIERVLGQSAVAARAKLRLGPVHTCEQIARMLDKALIRAEDAGLAPDTLVFSAGSAVAAEEIVRVRRKAHGVADWIASPTSDVVIVLRPKGLAALAEAPVPVSEPVVAPARVSVPETEAELAVREALYDVIDPDLGVNIVDLGFIRRITVSDNGFATITMTLTSAACPLTMVMESQIRSVLGEDGTEFAVEWEWLPSWKPADISPDGREQLQAIGFSAF